MEEVDESPFRARSNTWPLPRPDLQDEVYGASPSSEENEASDQIHLLSANGNHLLLSPESGDTVIPTTAHEVNLNKSQQLQSLVNGQQQLKKNTSRRNAWGNMSYADLITQAIQGSPDKRLTLSQIYEWMVQNVPYFKDKGDSNSSAGWKNSIRHNLSLHNRFMRVQNEGTGKSSWWMINPDAKPGKAARRRATSMETQKFEKKRGRVKKKVEAMRNGVIPETHSPSSSVSEGLDHFDESPLLFNLSPEFRARTSSNASSCGRLSPIPAIESDMHDGQVPPLSPLNHWNSDINRLSMYSEVNEPYTDKLVELANTMKLGGSGSFLSVNSKSSPTTQLSPASSHVTLTPGYSGFGSSISVNGGYVNGGGGSGGGSGSLSRNGSDPYFQTSAGIDSTITLTSLNAPNGRKSPQRNSFLNEQGSATFSLVNLSPSLSPAQSMDTIASMSSVSNSAASRIKQENQQSAAGGQFAARFPATSCNAVSRSGYGHVHVKSETGPTASQVVGHLLSLNNSLPNDLDFDSLQGGLECDVNSVIQHELNVDGNLDFNFDPMHGANAASSAAASNTAQPIASSHSWVH